MAKVWPVYDGYPNTVGGPWAELPLDDAIRVLDLRPEHFLMDRSLTPKFGDVKRNLTWLGYQHVIVEVGEDEVRGNWRSGFYRSPLPPAEVYFRLSVHRHLGDRWRDEWEKGQDADGDPAVWLWAILKADAPASEWNRDNRERIQTEVRKLVSESGIRDWVFVRFRKDEGQRVVS